MLFPFIYIVFGSVSDVVMVILKVLALLQISLVASNFTHMTYIHILMNVVYKFHSNMH